MRLGDPLGSLIREPNQAPVVNREPQSGVGCIHRVTTVILRLRASSQAPQGAT